ncbi:MAG: aminoacetone oxidase family FAD-binding enzyme, partial [Sneathiella sp.]|nr:aminoacetone oxidase family FAD-binding enzyme [Sneathiella sp.]
MSSDKVQKFDVIVIGGGAAGLMCAITSGNRGRRVLLLEKMPEVGKKILISGGGRCNFTNIGAAPDRYVSGNRHFCKSALRQYTQQDFINLVEKHGIAYHEKKLGQLFCDESAKQITEMLLNEAETAGVHIWCDAPAKQVRKTEAGFAISLDGQDIEAENIVIASGGLSIPKIGATDFAHRVAASFDLQLTELKPGLVPFTFDQDDMARFQGLTGVSADVEVSIGKVKFRENVLFTHKGVSGPAILQISSYWTTGDVVKVDFLPDEDLFEALKEARKEYPKSSVKK